MDIVFKIKHTCKLSAITSFAIGSILLMLFMITKKSDPFVYMGIWYLYIAFAINLILFFLVLISAIIYWEKRVQLFGHAMLLTLNIPIAIAYFFIVLNFIGS